MCLPALLCPPKPPVSPGPSHLEKAHGVLYTTPPPECGVPFVVFSQSSPPLCPWRSFFSSRQERCLWDRRRICKCETARGSLLPSPEPRAGQNPRPLGKTLPLLPHAGSGAPGAQSARVGGSHVVREASSSPSALAHSGWRKETEVSQGTGIQVCFAQRPGVETVPAVSPHGGSPVHKQIPS